MDDHVVQCDNCGKESEYRKGVYRIVYACGIEETGLMGSARGQVYRSPHRPTESQLA